MRVVRRSRLLRLIGRHDVTRIVTNTYSSCDMVRNVEPNVLGRCRVLQNALEEVGEPMKPPESVVSKPLRLMMLGNIVVSTKGYDLAAKLAERFAQSGMPAQIHVAGRPDEWGLLSRQVGLRSLGTTFHFYGESGDPQSFLRSGDAYLLLSRREGVPNSLLEAMALGLPCIATGVGDLPRLTRDRNELRLIPVGGVEAAYRAVAEFISDWEEAVAMGRRGRAWCEGLFSASIARESCLALVNEINAENSK
jgi:glycosyltransferase involved in cell wall biosynthesis